MPSDSPLEKAVKQKAVAEHDGKVSAYVRAAIERDLAGQNHEPSALGKSVLEDLCGSLRPDLSPRLKAALQHNGRTTSYEQSTILADLLTLFIEYREAGGIPSLHSEADILSESRMGLPGILLKWAQRWEISAEYYAHPREDSDPDDLSWADHCRLVAHDLREMYVYASKSRNFSPEKTPRILPEKATEQAMKKTKLEYSAMRHDQGKLTTSFQDTIKSAISKAPTPEERARQRVENEEKML